MHAASPSGGQAGSTSAAALLLAFVAGLLGGVLAATLIAPQAETAPQPADPALARTLASLDDTVRRLGAQVEQLGRELPRVPAPAEPLAGTSPAAPDLAPLVASVEQLVRAVRAQAGRPGGGWLPGLPVPLLSLPSTPPPPERLAAVAESDTDLMRDRHLFWSYQQLLDTYGRPQYISIGEGNVTWQYEAPDGNTIGFQIFDGMVMDFWN
ncbi:MAG: hypothetical protein ACYTG2_08410 [Planctomycetota bacterium]|jgi:hypothetical protein